MEQWFMDQLVTLYGVEDEDQLPIPFDFLELLDTDKEDREDLLKDKLADCPGGEKSRREESETTGGGKG